MHLLEQFFLADQCQGRPCKRQSSFPAVGFHGILSCNGAAMNSLGFRVGGSLSRSQDVEQCRRMNWCLFYLALESLIESCLAKSWSFGMLNLGPCLRNLKLRHVTHTSEKRQTWQIYNELQGLGWMNNKNCLPQSRKVSYCHRSLKTYHIVIAHSVNHNRFCHYHPLATCGISFISWGWHCCFKLQILGFGLGMFALFEA